MGGTYTRTITTVLAAALLLPAAVAADAAEPTGAAALFEERVIAAALDHGLDPEVVLHTPILLEGTDAAGEPFAFETTLDAIISHLEGVAVAPPPGAPHATVGDLFHIYVNFGVGSALAYDITTSAVVPNSPSNSDAAPFYIKHGGPTKNVKGSYAVGIHGAGTTYGSNVDTGLMALPVVDAAIDSDNKIDFVGQGSFVQGQACLLGICFAAGVATADGAALFDNHDVDMPIVP